MPNNRPEGTGKVVLVTGASSGIGAAIATRLSGEGYHVVAVARRDERLARLTENAPGELTTKPVDVTNRTAFTGAVEKIRTEYGRLDVIVNNAGIMLLSRLDKLRVDE